MTNHLLYLKSKIQIAVFASMAVLMISVVYWLFRFGFSDNSFLIIVKVVSLGFLVLTLPETISIILYSKKKKTEWFNSSAFFSLIILFILVLIGFLLQFYYLPLVYFLGALGLFSFFFLIVKSRLNWQSLILSLVASILFSILIIVLFWGYWGSGVFHNPLFLEKIFLGDAHLDTLFHSSVANMIKTYNIPTTGLNGLPYLIYHWGSHFLFAQVSRLLDVNVITFYNLVVPAIFAPFAFKAIFSFAIDIREIFHLSPEIKFRYWFYIFFLVSPFISYSFFIYPLVRWDIFTSESYLLVVAITFQFFSLILSFWQKIAKNSNFRTIDLYFLYLVVPVMLAIIGVIKISIMILILVAFFYLLLRLRFYRKRPYAISFILCLALSLLTYKMINLAGDIQIMPFSAFKASFGEQLDNLYFLVHLFLVWFYIFLRLKSNQITDLKTLVYFFKVRRLIDVELLLLISIVGVLPWTIFVIPSGSAIYFSGFQQILALSLILALLAKFFPGDKNKSLKFQIGRLKLINIAFVLLILPFIYICFSVTYNLLYSFVFENINMRNAIILKSNPEWKGARENIKYLQNIQGLRWDKALILTLKAPQEEMNKNPNFSIIKTLIEFGNLNPKEKKKTALFISQSNSAYWNMTSIYTYKEPFVAPAISGLAMIDGIRPYAPYETTGEFLEHLVAKKGVSNSIYQYYQKSDNANDYVLRDNLSQEEKIALYDAVGPIFYASLQYYGYESYQFPTEKEFLDRTNNEESLCRNAKEKGFLKVVMLESINNIVSPRTIDCR